jgi:hypothetical protein
MSPTSRALPILFILGLAVALSACANGRLTNDEIDATCLLIQRCTGIWPSCVSELLAERDVADALGCSGENGEVYRCLLAADSCLPTAACLELGDARDACFVEGPPVEVDWLERSEAARRQYLETSCRLCPGGISCPYRPLLEDARACLRRVGALHPEVPAFYRCMQPRIEAYQRCILENEMASCEDVYEGCALPLSEGCPVVPEAAARAVTACLDS